jgi:hypothetical protein
MSGGGASASSYRHPLLASTSTFLGFLATVSDVAAKRRVRWTPQAASTAAVLMAWDRGCSLQSRFADALGCLGQDLRGTGRTYNGLLKALERQQQSVLPLIKSELRRHVGRRAKHVDPRSPWMLLAVDGSKEDLPRTRDLEAVFGIGDNGVFPQALVTAIVEVHTGLPWDWRIDKARGSEKKHLMDMASDLPGNALLLGDGCFVGLPIWSKLHSLGKRFLIRVGGNVRLLKNLWPGSRTHCAKDIVYVWPQKSRKKTPPLRLRLIRAGGRSNPVYLLTNILDSRQLSRKDAGVIYRLRWGVELFYRTFKRTMDFAKLQSRAGRRAKIELEWALIALTIATLLGLDALKRSRRDVRRLSPAMLVETLRSALLREATVAQQCLRRLSTSLKDQYQRRSSKQSRHRLITRNTPKPLILNPPLIRNATAQEKRDALKFFSEAA